MAKGSQAVKTSSNSKAKATAKQGNNSKASGKTGGNGAKASSSDKGNSSRKAAASKNNAKGRENTRAAGYNEDTDEEIFLGGEIAVWAIGAVMLILELANFGLCGGVTVISNFFFGIFGAVQYVIPAAILVSTFFLYVNEFKPRAVQKVVFACLVLVGIGMISQMTEGIPDIFSAKDIYMGGYKEHAGGGLLCGSLAFILNKAVGKVGTYIIILLIIIICVVLFAEISLIDVIRSFIGDIIARDKDYDEYEYEDEYDDRISGIDDKEEGKASNKKRGKKNKKIVVEDFSDARKAQGDTNSSLSSEKKGSILENISVLPDDPSKGIMPGINPGGFPDNEDVHEITMDFPVNLPGENMDSFEVNEVDKEAVKAASGGNKKVRKSIVPTVLPAEDNTKIESPGIDDVNKTDLFPEQYDAYGDVDMPDSLNITTGASGDITKATGGSSSGRKKNTVKRNALGGQVSGTVIDSVKDLSGSNNGDGGAAGSGEASGALGETLTNSEKEAIMTMENKTAKEEKNLSAKEVGSSDAEYHFPPLELLKRGKNSSAVREETIRENAMKLQEVLKSFGVNVTMTNCSCGPSVTRYEMVPEQGVKVSKITGLADDIMMNLAAQSIRIEAPIPGKSAVGIEIPNGERTGVGFRELIDTERFIKHPSKIAFAVGKDIEGNVIVEDIAKMPHLLIAGATGSGKSVCTNTLIMSILYKARPDEVKLILVDPKQVELKVYNGIPHLLTPVVTDPKKAAGALNWAVAEMTDRYQKFSECNVRNIQGYNEKVEELKKSDDIEEVTIEKMPQIVIIVDELADLMMVAKAEVEEAIVRLAQLARAAGIHLVIATQRPSVDVVTGLIKANVPSRIALSVSSGIDSRTIIDTVGAEKLLGNGDMLFYPTMYPKPLRVQGAYISDDEVVSVVEFLKANNGETTYSEEMTNKITSSGAAGTAGASGDAGSGSDRDEYFVQAGKFIIEKNKASIGMLQRMFKIGFNRAARIMDQLSEAGVVGPEVGTKPREVLMTEEQFEEYVDEYF